MRPTSKSYPEQAEAFLAELEEEYYRNGAGLESTSDLTPIYEKYAHLFSEDEVNRLLTSRRTKQVRHLARFAASQHLDRSVCALTDSITTAETQATLEWDGTEVPYRVGIRLASRESDRQRRAALSGRLSCLTAKLNEARAARISQLHVQAKRLGFGGYRELCDDLLDLRLDWLNRQMTTLLAESDSLWEQELSSYLDEAGVPLHEAQMADLRYLLTAPQFDHLFPGEHSLPLLRKTLAAMGIDLDAHRNLCLDTDGRELKSPRAFCSPVRVPSDIRLVTTPRGGREDYNMLFHEAGHALHFAHTDSTAPFAFRCLGDYSVAEAYAFTLNMVLRSPFWLPGIAGVPASAAYLRFARFYQLYYLRRIGAQLAYELELHALDAPTDDLPARYAERLGRALMVQISPEDYLSDIDDGFYSACYLRAWILEVQLRLKLIEEFGEAWFTRPEAGDYLKGLWAHGQEFTAEEVARKLDYPGLQVEPLIADLTSPVEA